MNKILSALVFLIVCTQVGFAQHKSYLSSTCKWPVEIEQWTVVDLVYKVKKTIEQPFEKEVFALVNADGVNQKVPLFFNGNNEWVLRYSSFKSGTKNFLIQSEISELNGKKGSFLISDNKKSNRHGGVVRMKENPRHFFYEDGKPYFNLAFECDWLFALDYGSPDLSKTNQLLDQIANNGFTQIVMNVYAFDVDTNWVKDSQLQIHPEHNYGAREDIFPFLGTNSKPDYTGLNIDFFIHFDKVISAMHDRELVSHLMIYVWNKLVNWPQPGSVADNRYYDYIIKRYQAFPNIIWDVSKEAASKIAVGKYSNIVEHIAERIDRTRNLDGYNRLVSVHDYGFCREYRDKVDFISIQDWTLSIYDQMVDAYNTFPEMPVFNIEHGGYEKSPYNVFPGGYDNAEVCLRRNYLCLFAGTYTTYYWQGAAWTAIIHNPFEQPEGVVKPHFEYFKYMTDFFSKINYENFEPVTKYNSRSFNLTSYKNGTILLYLPKEVYNDDVKNQLDKEFDYSNATKQWFNTLTGEYTRLEKLEFKNYYTIWDNRPWRNEADAILIIRNLKKK